VVFFFSHCTLVFLGIKKPVEAKNKLKRVLWTLALAEFIMRSQAE
jgi:hypothetical protein